jgi:hypothetical protein
LNNLVAYRWGAFLIFCFAFSSCCSEADLTIQTPLRAWIPYQKPQRIKFTSATGDTLTFLVKTTEYKQTAHDKACGTYTIQTLETTLTLASDSAVKALVSVSHEVVVNIKVNAPEKTSPVINAKFNTVSGLFISDDFRDKYLLNFSFNGQNYPEVLHVYGVPTPGSLYFADLLYAKNVGLIGFKTFDDRWFALL